LSLELKVLIVVTESHAPDILLSSLWFVVDVPVLFFFCENSDEISVSQSRRSWENGGVGIFAPATTRSIYPARMKMLQVNGRISPNGLKVWGNRLAIYSVPMTMRYS
jgi:hypothetical protein